MSASDSRPLPRRFLNVAARRSCRVANTGRFSGSRTAAGTRSGYPSPAAAAAQARAERSSRATARARSCGSGAPSAADDVEHVDRLRAEGRDEGRAHVDAERRQRRADPVQQARPVVRAHLEHGRRTAGAGTTSTRGGGARAPPRRAGPACSRSASRAATSRVPARARCTSSRSRSTGGGSPNSGWTCHTCTAMPPAVCVEAARTASRLRLSTPATWPSRPTRVRARRP